MCGNAVCLLETLKLTSTSFEKERPLVWLCSSANKFEWMFEQDVPLWFDEDRGWQVASKDFSHCGVLDERQLETETDDDAHDQCSDEALEDPQSPHGAGWAVEDQNHKDVDNGDCTSGDQRDIEEQIEGYGGSDDL